MRAPNGYRNDEFFIPERLNSNQYYMTFGRFIDIYIFSAFYPCMQYLLFSGMIEVIVYQSLNIDKKRLK